MHLLLAAERIVQLLFCGLKVSHWNFHLLKSVEKCLHTQSLKYDRREVGNKNLRDNKRIGRREKIVGDQLQKSESCLFMLHSPSGLSIFNWHLPCSKGEKTKIILTFPYVGNVQFYFE